MTLDDTTTARALNIVHVVDSLERGGLERMVVDLALAQRGCGHRVSIFSLLATEGLATEVKAAGLPLAIGDKRKSFDTRVIRHLRAFIREQQASIVHTHNFVPNYYTAAALLPAPAGTTQITTCHDMGMRLSDRKLRWLYLASLRRTRRVAMVSQQVMQRYIEAGWVHPERARTIVNGIPTERFVAVSQHTRRAARQALGVPDDAFVIGCVGRLVPVKNHALAIRAFSRLSRAHAQCRLVLIGKGPSEDALRALARELAREASIVFAGERPDVARLLPAFDVFAMPSRSEGLSIALLEACATGLAIVATDVGGNHDVLAGRDMGLLVPPDDEDALSEALGRCLHDPALRNTLGARAREWAKREASIDATRRAYDIFYAEAMRR